MTILTTNDVVNNLFTVFEDSLEAELHQFVLSMPCSPPFLTVKGVKVNQLDSLELAHQRLG